jgi:hypothetical protein
LKQFSILNFGIETYSKKSTKDQVCHAGLAIKTATYFQVLDSFKSKESPFREPSKFRTATLLDMLVKNAEKFTISKLMDAVLLV